MIYQMVEALPYDEATPGEAAPDDSTLIDNTAGNICFLALLLEGKAADKVGRSFSLATRFNIENGAIYLGYKVI
jgi:hypothetical protein